MVCGTQAEQMLDVLDRSDLTSYEKLDKLMTTAVFTEPALTSLYRFTELGRRVYHYHFARSSPSTIAYK